MAPGLPKIRSLFNIGIEAPRYEFQMTGRGELS